jgi:tetratricopeptide (TPR) repeat protein
VRFAVLLVLAIAPAVAHADDHKVEADAVYKDGEAFYAKKAYLQAAGAFERSYALDPDPAVLFNIAQAYRLAHACAQAARYYHQFVAAVPNPPERGVLDRYMADMDACAKAEASATKPTVIHDTKVVHDTVHDTKIVHEKASLALPIALGVTGVVALAIGAAYSLDVSHVQRDRDALCPAGCTWPTVADRAAHLDQRAQRAEVGEAVAYAAGGAAAIAGAVLFALGRRGADDGLVVTPTPTGASVLFKF